MTHPSEPQSLLAKGVCVCGSGGGGGDRRGMAGGRYSHDLIDSYQQPYEVGTPVISILQMVKLRQEE